MKRNHVNVAICGSLHFLLVLTLALFAWPCFAGVIYVPGNYPTIQQAIDASVDGDEIIVSAGTYVENIDFGGKNIVLRSTDPTDPAVVAGTVIDGNGAGSVVTFGGTEDETCVLAGFTITNGSTFYGGGISGNDTHATIRHNIISANSAQRGGGLAYCHGTIQNNTVSGNSGGHDGGGLYLCDGTIQNNIISNNSANEGGGLYCCDGTIQNNTISGNDRGGLEYCRGTIKNCIIWGNDAPTGAQLDVSSTPSYSCVQDWSGGGVGNIADDPLLVNAGNGDFHLSPGSPCIDAGYTYYLFGQYLVDIDGECRLAGVSVDMGADEYRSSVDSDGDLLADDDEVLRGCSISDGDTDDDGLMDGAEVLRGTAPTVYDSPTGVSIPGDFADIQEGLFLAFPSETVTVSPGTYHENLLFMGKNVVLQSMAPVDPDIVAITIIDGNGAGPVVSFLGTEDETCVLAGFTLTNGYASYGGGICGNGTHATVQNNTISGNSADISGNSADDNGGGLWGCDGTIQNNTISGNSAYDNGGGLAYCDGTIQNNVISGNLANRFGGGGLAYCHGTIQNNIISGNYATYAGGLDRCDGTIQNNTIWGNSASGNAGGLEGCRGTIKNCIIWGNDAPGQRQLYLSSTPSYSCVQDWSGGGLGNIVVDPLLVDPGNGDFHLSPGSPCIDAGYTYYLFGQYLVDIDGECRLAGVSVDMGADEYGSSPDSDGDLLADDDEIVRGSSISDRDTDDDGLIDGAEVLRGTDPTVYDSPTGVSIPSDFPEIQQGLFVAFPSETITVSPGTYHENLLFMGKNVVLVSIDPVDPDIVAITIIDGNGAGSVVTFLGTEDETCVLAGFTVTNGYACLGGGISGNGTRATIRDNIISGNSSDRGGGLSNCDGTIRNNTISGNSAGEGGGGLLRCDGTIQNNTISGNSAGGAGGGLSNCDGTIQNNTISGNSAGPGGGLSDCDGAIQHNTISGNSAGYSGGGLKNCHGTIQNNTISGNSANSFGGGLTYCDGPIQNNTISDNSAEYGGGLHRCHGTIRNNTVSGNSADWHGGGLAWCFGPIHYNTIWGNSTVWRGGGLYSCSGTIRNNTIWGNSAGLFGGGLYDCEGPIHNNTVWGNSAEYGGGLYKCHGGIQNCIIWGNNAPTGAQLYLSSTPSYSCVQDWAGGGLGNIVVDPLLVDPANGDLHLSPGSPCIDAGYTYYLFGQYLVDIDGECRLAGVSVDMGADEYGSSPDSDGDLLADDDEILRGSSISDRDTDDDGLIDGAEVLRGTAPTVYDSPTGVSIPWDFADIQEGLFLAFPSETMTVSPGTYHENLLFMGKNVVLQSIDPIDPDIVAITVIDGNGAGPVARFFGTEDETCVLAGFTVTNGCAFYGAGISGNGTHATIQNNIISGNSADDGRGLAPCDDDIQNSILARGHGGGLADCDGAIQNNIISGNSAIGFDGVGGGLAYCDGTIQDNIISGNSATSGGGLSRCSGTIRNNTISGNSAIYFHHCSSGAGGGGGGLSMCDGTIRNNTISGNSATSGGGLSGCHGTIQNNTISGNSASVDGGGLAGGWHYLYEGAFQNNIISGNSAGERGGGLHSYSGTIQSNTIWANSAGETGGGLDGCRYTIKNCIIWGNGAPTGAQLDASSTPSYSCIQDWLGGGVGNIVLNPLLVDPGNGDFHLEPGSPCIDTGGDVPGLTEDFEGDPRPWDDPDASGGDGSNYDMGADEYVPFGDVDGDGRANAVDIQLVINGALDLPVGYDCDLDGDGYVTAVDIQLVINAVLRSK